MKKRLSWRQAGHASGMGPGERGSEGSGVDFARVAVVPQDSADGEGIGKRVGNAGGGGIEAEDGFFRSVPGKKAVKDGEEPGAWRVGIFSWRRAGGSFKNSVLSFQWWRSAPEMSAEPLGIGLGGRMRKTIRAARTRIFRGGSVKYAYLERRQFRGAGEDFSIPVIR